MTNIVERAIAVAGGVAALARAAGVKHTSVIGWRDRGMIPAERALAIEAITGISRGELRPDLWGVPALASPELRTGETT
jgi:DNA-binding transcriptional regulator YdaS (Cro superfamily)